MRQKLGWISLGELNDLVNRLVAGLLVLLRRKTLANLLGLLEPVVLLDGQGGDTGLETNGLEEATLFEVEFAPLGGSGIGRWGAGAGIRWGCGSSSGVRIDSCSIGGLLLHLTMAVVSVVSVVSMVAMVAVLSMVSMVAVVSVMTFVTGVEGLVVHTDIACDEFVGGVSAGKGSDGGGGSEGGDEDEGELGRHDDFYLVGSD